MAGLTYVCEDDFSYILEHKCIEIDYRGLEEKTEFLQKKVCGRELINFLNGFPIEVPSTKWPFNLDKEPGH